MSDALDAAVEAAAKARWTYVQVAGQEVPWADVHESKREMWRAHVRPLVEAAAPYIAVEAFDEGVSIAGRYGHEDSWDWPDNTPYQHNPYRENK